MEKEKGENMWRRGIFFAEKKKKEEGKEEIIWRQKISISAGKEKHRRKRRKIFGEGKIVAGRVDGTEIEGSTKGPRGPKK